MATDPVKAAAQRYNLSPALFRALVQQESGGNQGARSKAGAIGETQLMPGTAASLGVNPYNQRQNLDGGAKYLRQQLDRFGSVRKALAAYNAGPGAVQRYGGVPPFAETENYVKAILANAGQGAGAPTTSARARSTATAPTGAGGVRTRTITTTPGVDNAPLRQQLVGNFLQAGGVKNSGATLAFAAGMQGAQDKPGTRTVRTSNAPSAGQPAPRAAAPAPSSTGLASFDGKPVAGWIAPILQRARASGLWKGTVTSGYRTDAQQKRIYDSGVRPAAVPKSEGGSGSNHEGANFPYGAVDVSDAAGLAAALRRLGVNRLQYAGAKDPVHFSHPHGGGY